MPVITDVMGDVRKEVTVSAEKALADCCGAIGNRDIEPFIPVLVSCMARPAEVPETVERLAATTFVQSVEPPALALMEPVLARGLAERATAVKRKASIIIDNMCKLVSEPSFAAPFLPKLLPGLERVKEETSDPECRSVASRAYATLRRAAGDTGAAGAKVPEVQLKAQPADVLASLREVLKATLPAKATAPDAALSAALAHIAGLASALIDSFDFEHRAWEDNAVYPYLTHLLGEKDTSALCAAFLAVSKKAAKLTSAKVEEEEEGEDLCDCEFSLAYGGKILLNCARLHLKRGKRYGLCGPNGVGKSTLMRAISNGQLDGFPPADKVRTGCCVSYCG